MPRRWNPRLPWGEIPVDLLLQIVRCLPCLADRLNISMACRSWHKAVEMVPLPHQLPYLILPWRRERHHPPDGDRRPSLFSVIGNGTHRHIRLPRARCFGSYDGGWIFLANHQTHGHALINLYSNRSIPIPDTARLFRRNTSTIPMTFLAATLSSTPPPLEGPAVPYDLQCLGGAIVFTRCTDDLHFNTPSMMVWLVRDPDPEVFAFEATVNNLPVVDVIYYHGAFHFLTEKEDLIILTPHLHRETRVAAFTRDLKPLQREHEDGDDHQVNARYLVESRGDLLMVLRCAPRPPFFGTPRPPLPASSFRVFQMTQQPLPEPELVGASLYTWTELPALGGRMLFVAPGCSRSYEVADFPGFEDGVYFLDDRDFGRVDIMSYREQFRVYSCDDNGRWLEQPPGVRRWFPGEPTSRHSSPVWFLP